MARHRRRKTPQFDDNTINIFKLKKNDQQEEKTKDSYLSEKEIYGDHFNQAQSTSTIKDLTLSNLRLFLFLKLVAVEKLESGELGP